MHLAIRCASCKFRVIDSHCTGLSAWILGETISLLLSHRSISPNAVFPPGSGTTALHLAASLSRTDVVNLLLEQEGIDDSLRDAQGKTCLEVARGKDTIHAIRGKHYLCHLRSPVHISPSRFKIFLDCVISFPPSSLYPQPPEFAATRSSRSAPFFSTNTARGSVVLGRFVRTHATARGCKAQGLATG